MRLFATLLLALTFTGPALAETPPVFDQVAPALPSALPHPAFLVLSKANGYRHDSIPVVSTALNGLAAKHGWTIFDTSNAAVFNSADLKRFDVIVLNNTTGDLFTSDQRVAFRQWVEGGGRVVALHGAGGTNPAPWAWYSDELIGARFTGHPVIQPGVLRVEPGQAITSSLPAAWTHSDEWYSFDRSPRRADTHVLASVDETTYAPTAALAMGADHPILWTRCVGGGGSFFTAIGHQNEHWSDPVFLSMVDGAMVWALDHTQPAC